MAALQQPEPTKDQGSLGILLFCGENTLGILHLAPVSSISIEVELGESAGKILWEIKSCFIMIFFLIEPPKNPIYFVLCAPCLFYHFWVGFVLVGLGLFVYYFFSTHFSPYMGCRHKFHMAV